MTFAAPVRRSASGGTPNNAAASQQPSSRFDDGSTVAGGGSGVSAMRDVLHARRRDAVPPSVRRLTSLMWLIVLAFLIIGPVWAVIVYDSLDEFSEGFHAIRVSHNRTELVQSCFRQVRRMEDAANPNRVPGLPLNNATFAEWKDTLLTTVSTLEDTNAHIFGFEVGMAQKYHLDVEIDVVVSEFSAFPVPHSTMTGRGTIWELAREFTDRVRDVQNLTLAEFFAPVPLYLSVPFRFIIDNGVHDLPEHFQNGDRLDHEILTESTKRYGQKVQAMLFTLLGVMLTAMVLLALSWRQVIVDVGALSLFLDLPRHVTRTLRDPLIGRGGGPSQTVVSRAKGQTARGGGWVRAVGSDFRGGE
jgi:hypothetical protein